MRGQLLSLAFPGQRGQTAACTPLGTWGVSLRVGEGAGGVPPEGGNPSLSGSQAGVGGSAVTPRRGRLTPLGLAGGWGAACSGLVP